MKSIEKIGIRGPIGGYNFEAKDKYRRNVWSILTQSFNDEIPWKALFFPSIEGLEIPIALGHGLKQENLIAVDDNPDAIEKSEWRKKYRYCNK